MSKQQLYINDVAVDMPKDEIKISVPSNVMSDVGNIMTAHSYSITLPRTMNNDSIMHNAYVASAETGGISTHRYMSCALYVDGVPLFDGGYCSLDSVEEKGYKISLFWGLLGLFDVIKDEGLDVCDLQSSKMVSGEDGTTWLNMINPDTGRPINLNLYVSGMNNDLYAQLDDDSKELAKALPWGLPVFSADEILQYIQSVYGLTLDIHPMAQARIDNLYIAPTSLSCLGKEERCVINYVTAWELLTPSTYGLAFKKTNTTGYYDYPYLSPLNYDTPTSAYHTASNKWQANNAIMSPNGLDALLSNCRIVVEKVRIFGYDTKPFKAQVNDGEVQDASWSSGYYRMDYTVSDEFSVDKNAQFLRVWSNSTSSSLLASNINVQLTLKEIDISEGCYTEGGNWWSYVRNYPQMSVVDYLNEILAHIGGCAIGSVTKPNALRITTWDVVAGNAPKSYDAEGVKSIKMTYEKLAQRNTYAHRENDDNGTNYTGEGVTYTEDSTLPLERKAFESKFKVPQNVMVRLWKLEKDPDSNKYKATWADGGDYLVGYDSDANVVRNTGQDFKRTIANYYAPYVEVTNRPKVVEAVVRMPILDLMAFDFEHTAYINQLGRKYFVINIDSEGYDKYTLELLQV